MLIQDIKPYSYFGGRVARIQLQASKLYCKPIKIQYRASESVSEHKRATEFEQNQAYEQFLELQDYFKEIDKNIDE